MAKHIKFAVSRETALWFGPLPNWVVDYTQGYFFAVFQGEAKDASAEFRKVLRGPVGQNWSRSMT